MRSTIFSTSEWFHDSKTLTFMFTGFAGTKASSFPSQEILVLPSLIQQIPIESQLHVRHC